LVLLVRRGGRQRTAANAVLLLLVCMLVAVAASPPPRVETRYVVFLYPLIVVRAFQVILWLGERWRLAAPAAACLALALFALSEDFHPRHLLIIDSREATLREDLSAKLTALVVPHSDVRGAAQWLSEHASGGAVA